MRKKKQFTKSKYKWKFTDITPKFFASSYLIGCSVHTKQQPPLNKTTENFTFSAFFSSFFLSSFSFNLLRFLSICYEWRTFCRKQEAWSFYFSWYCCLKIGDIRLFGALHLFYFSGYQWLNTYYNFILYFISFQSTMWV